MARYGMQRSALTHNVAFCAGNQEHGWNDPPQFSYGSQKDSGGPKRNILNKRVHAPQFTGQAHPAVKCYRRLSWFICIYCTCIFGKLFYYMDCIFKAFELIEKWIKLITNLLFCFPSFFFFFLNITSINLYCRTTGFFIFLALLSVIIVLLTS